MKYTSNTMVRGDLGRYSFKSNNYIKKYQIFNSNQTEKWQYFSKTSVFIWG